MKPACSWVPRELATPRQQRRLIAGWGLLACFVLSADALAQGRLQAPSPATLLDLTKPQFDTVTPHYDVSGASAKAASTLVADVSGRAITLGEVGDAVRALPATVRSLPFDSVYPAIIQQLIKLQAMVVQAQQQGLDKDPVAIRRIKAAADRALTNELVLREAGSAVTEKAMLNRYDQQYAGKPGPEEVHVRAILVATEVEANTIIAELAGGTDFGDIARRSSRDTSAPYGGNLGFVSRETLTAEIGAVAFSMAAGQTTRYPVRTVTGWFVLRVDERRQGPTPTYEAVKETIHDTLLREGITAVAQTALTKVNVHAFDISGKDVRAEVDSRQ